MRKVIWVLLLLVCLVAACQLPRQALSGWERPEQLSAAQNREVVTLNVGDQVTIDHAVPAEGSESAILDGYTLTIVKRALSPVVTEPVHISEFQDSADTQA